MWQLVYDPTSGGSYYYNSETGESQWERPQNYWTPRGHESTAGVAAAADAAYDPNADASTGAQAGIGAAEEEWVDPNVLRSHGPWRVYFDADSGYEYYHNTETEEVVWDPPVPELAPDTPYGDDEEFFDGDADGGDGALAAEGPLAGMSAEHLSNVAAALCYNRYKPAVPHPLAKHGPWELFLDPDAQKMYYCNSDTGQSLWEVPPDWNDAEAYVPPLAKFGDWQVYRDHTSLAEYYTNAELGQTTWEVPAALLVQVRTVEMQESQLALEAAKAQAAGACGVRLLATARMCGTVLQVLRLAKTQTRAARAQTNVSHVPMVPQRKPRTSQTRLWVTGRCTLTLKRSTCTT